METTIKGQKWYVSVRASNVRTIIEDWLYTNQECHITIHHGNTEGCRTLELTDWWYVCRLRNSGFVEQMAEKKVKEDEQS